MWSLPKINAMNARAAAQASRLEQAARRGPSEGQECERCGCSNCATESHLVYDIFSDDPKDIVHVCEDCPPESVENIFFCDGCERLMFDHITWERYQVEIDDRVLCLACAARQYFEDKENWIDPAKVKRVEVIGKGQTLFNPRTGVLNLNRCRHVLGVKQPLPAGVAFHDNAEFDSSTGQQISGENLLDVIRRLNQPFCPVLDAAYQFAVSIGIYVRNSAEVERQVAA